MKIKINESWNYYEPQFEYEKIFNDLEWPWAGHKDFAYDLIRNIKPNLIVELGTHKGTSFFSMCQAVKDSNLKTKLYAIDIWKGDRHAGFYDETVFNEVNKIKKTYYPKQNIIFLRSLFDNTVTQFKNNSIDLLHIDGMHTYKAVKHDFDNWFNKVSKNGIIIFHDTNEKHDDFGVYKLWNILKKEYKTLEFFHSHGLGILFKNYASVKDHKVFENIWQKYYPLLTDKKVLKTQLQQSQAETEIVKKNFFQKSLETENYKKELEQAKKQLSQLSSLTIKNQNLQNQINQVKTEIQNLENTLNIIKSAKFFKLWQQYNKIKRLIWK